jgi:hypothetical protein
LAAEKDKSVSRIEQLKEENQKELENLRENFQVSLL